MKKNIFLIFLFTCFYANSQAIKTQILENVSKINSINLNDTNFSDLEVIGRAIGNAKIVFLGEQDHGDATTFEAKIRIIKYLHEKKGFNVLTFESDFFSINKKSDEKKSVTEIEKSIFPIWSNCLQVNPLFNYIQNQQKTNPLILSGFDCQIAQNYEDDSDRNNYMKTIKNYIENNVIISKVNDYQLFQKTLKDLIFFVKATKNKKAHFKKIKKSIQKKFFNTLSEILSEIPNKKTFLFQSLKNVEAYAKMAWKVKNGQQERDFQMGKNIIWLHKVKFPNEKIIVWAHSLHLIKKAYADDGKRLYYNISAGEYTYNNLNKEDIYSIGFTSRKGETQRTSLNRKHSKYTVKKPKKESFENWIYSKKLDFAFVNFRALKNTSETFYMKGYSHYNYKANWLDAFDGMFYINKMFPCVKEK